MVEWLHQVKCSCWTQEQMETWEEENLCSDSGSGSIESKQWWANFGFISRRRIFGDFWRETTLIWILVFSCTRIILDHYSGLPLYWCAGAVNAEKKFSLNPEKNFLKIILLWRFGAGADPDLKIPGHAHHRICGCRYQRTFCLSLGMTPQLLLMKMTLSAIGHKR